MILEALQHVVPTIHLLSFVWCRLARSLHEPNLDTWRPRVNGVQLKALHVRILLCKPTVLRCNDLLATMWHQAHVVCIHSLPQEGILTSVNSCTMQGVRLPDSSNEWATVQAALEGVSPAFKPDSSPAAMLTDLMALADECSAWWDTRNRSAGANSRLPVEVLCI